MRTIVFLFVSTLALHACSTSLGYSNKHQLKIALSDYVAEQGIVGAVKSVKIITSEDGTVEGFFEIETASTTTDYFFNAEKAEHGILVSSVGVYRP